jgi:predicted GNAT family N-acyltransferase
MLKFVCLNDITEEIRNLRFEVFVREQNIAPEIELESDEYNYSHLCLYKDEVLVAYARARSHGEIMHLGRILVKKEYRGQGLGAAIMNYCEQTALDRGCKVLELNAQYRAIGFYEKMGFIAEGDYFTEAGIRHKKMKKVLE